MGTVHRVTESDMTEQLGTQAQARCGFRKPDLFTVIMHSWELRKESERQKSHLVHSDMHVVCPFNFPIFEWLGELGDAHR